MFGVRGFDQQYVAYRLAELLTEVEGLRALLYRATWEMVGGTDVTLLTVRFVICYMFCAVKPLLHAFVEYGETEGWPSGKTSD